jgi:hypothetical protein
MKDVTATSFGLAIAYLVPGLVGLYGLSFWDNRLRKTFDTFLTAESNIGLFFLVVFAALTAGLVAHGLRFVLFEKLFPGPTDHLKDGGFGALSDEGKREAFQAAVDQEFRYHQLWGGLFVVAPIAFLGELRESWSGLDSRSAIGALLVCCFLEGLFLYIAIMLRRRYLARITAILKG